VNWPVAQMRVLMIKDHIVIIIYSTACVVFCLNLAIALIAGSIGHAALWAFAATCFGAAAYRTWRRSRDDRQNEGETSGDHD
jgi:hypothetical protein